ncbi:MAG: hypothetical protein ACLGHX_05080 [Acidimicrobiia bacterium]
METLLTTIIVLTSFAAPAEVDVTDLISDGESWNNSVVTVTGELIGDYSIRDDGSMWTQVNQDSYAVLPASAGGEAVGGNNGIAVRFEAAAASELDPPGRYRRTGPVVRITGTWKWHDPDRGGESYLRATSFQILEPGQAWPEEPELGTLAGSLILVGLAAGLLIAPRRRRL